MAPPHLDLESAAHEASRSHPTSKSPPPSSTKPFQRDIQVHLVSTCLPLLFLVLFVAAATIVLVFTLNQHIAIPSHMVIRFAATIGIILTLWCGLAMYLCYGGRMAGGPFCGCWEEVGCSGSRKQRAAFVETVMGRINEDRCEADELERA